MSNQNYYIQVFNDGRFSLSYPQHLWREMPASERLAVVKRQGDLARLMRKKRRNKTRKKV